MATSASELEFTSITRIAGQDEDFAADVVAGSDGKYRLAVDVLGNISLDSAKKTFVVTALNIATANNKSMLSLQNTTGSTVVLKLRQLFIRNDQTTAVTGVINDLGMYRATSHSVGTLLTPLAMDTADTLSASITARTGATIVGEAASPMFRWKFSNDEWGPGAIDVESYHFGFDQNFSKYEPTPGTKPFTLRANESMTIKCLTSTTVGIFTIVAIFTEE